MARFLLIHGAMGGAWVWERVIAGLGDAGHQARAIDLPGQGADTTPIEQVTLCRYADAVCEALADGAGPSLLVGHSMGGMVITQAASQRPEHVAALIYVAAFLPGSGQSLIDLTGLPEAAGDSVQANIVVEGDPPVATMPPERAPEAVFHCATEEQLAWAMARRGSQPVLPFTQPFTPPPDTTAFDALPRAYVTCLQDRAIKPALQRRMAQTAGASPVIEIDTDHSPWLTRTGELVAALGQIAERFGRQRADRQEGVRAMAGPGSGPAIA